MEERQIKDISTLLPPLPPRPKGSILPLPVPKKSIPPTKQQNPHGKRISSSNLKKGEWTNTKAPSCIHYSQLPLQEIINKYATDIPFCLSAFESFYAICEKNSLIAGTLLDVHFIN